MIETRMPSGHFCRIGSTKAKVYVRKWWGFQVHVGRCVYRDQIITHSGSLLLNSTRLTSFSTMAVLHLFVITIFLLGILRTYSVPYEGVYLEFPTSPKLIHAASESNPASNGYSYSTRDVNGDGSKVVFTTGADSMSRLKDEMNSFYEANVMRILENYSQEDTLDKIEENLVSSGQQSKSEEAEPSANKQEDLNLNAEIPNDEKNPSKKLEHQTPLRQFSLIRVPYPAVRSNLLNLRFPTATFPRYHISQSAIQSQDYPRNLYTHLELPSHDLGFYNPAVPLFYHVPTTVSANSLRHSATVEDTKVSMEQDIAGSSRINATVPESSSAKSDMIESRSNLGSIMSTVNETSLNETTTSEFKLTTESKDIKEEITTAESVNSTMKTEDSNEQTMQKEVNNTEVANRKCACRKKSGTETSTASATEI